MTRTGTIAGAAALAAVGAAVAAQMPEIKRYMKIRRM
jgi:hypothetical protein